MIKVKEVYKKQAITIQNNIAVFCKDDAYTKNYESISIDHLSSVREGLDNPFIENSIWEEMENSTYVLVEKYLEKENMLLDVGVGLGRLLDKCSDVVKFGVDVSMQNLLQSQSKGIEVCLAKAEDLPYNDTTFDLVISTDVLEHAPDLNAALTEMTRVLKKGGKLIIRVPYKEDLSLYLGKNYPYYYSHLRNFDESSLILICEKIFKMNHIETTYTTYLPIANKLKCQLSSVFNKLLWRVLALIRKISAPLYLHIAPYFLYPIEMNIVFEK